MSLRGKHSRVETYRSYYPAAESPYLDSDYDEWNVETRQGSARYKSWSLFQKKYPFNSQLLIHLFGDRDAIDCHMSMQVMSEVKAATLCSFFLANRTRPCRVSIVSDC